MTKEFQIGNKVKVINAMQTYTTYDKWLEHVGQSEKSAGRKVPKDGDFGVIVALHPHLDYEERLIAGIEISGKVYMIEVKGIEIVEFDITAPIERQYTRSGVKVLEIYKNASEGAEPALRVLLHVGGFHVGYNEDGTHATAKDDRLDIVTRPAVLPNVVYFVNAYSNDLGATYDTLESADYHKKDERKGVFKFTYNPNTDTLTTEKV